MTTEAPQFSWARATAWLVAANVLRNVALLAILVALAQLTTPAVVGRYALALALTGPTFVLAQLGLKGVYLTLRRDVRFSTYLLVQAGSVLLAFAVSFVVAMLTDPTILPTVILVSAIKTVDCYFELFSGVLQRFHRTQLVFLSYLVAAAVGTAAVVVVLLAGLELELALAALVAVNVVVALSTAGRAALRITRHRVAEGHRHTDPRPDETRMLFSAGFPVGLAAAIFSLVSTIPQYFLVATAGPAAVGYFAVLLYLLAIADIFGGTLTQAWIPRGRAALESAAPGALMKSALRDARRWTLIFIPLVTVGLLVASLVIPFAFSPDYRLEFAQAVPLWITIMLLPLMHFSSTGMAVRNLYVHSIPLSVVGAAVSFVGCLLLVPWIAVAGAFWAIAGAYLARAVAALAILWLAERRSVQASSAR